MIVRSPRTLPFTTLPNDTIRDKRLGLKARGLLVTLLSMPDGWQTNSDRLARTLPDGRDSIRSALRELEDAGYVVRTRRRQPDGTFITETVIHDLPRNPQATGENPVEKHESYPPPETGFPASVSQALLERTTKKELTTKGLTRTKEDTPRLCGQCDGTGWTINTEHDLTRCTCHGGLQ